LKEPGDKIRMFRTLLKGQTLSYFERYLKTRLEVEDSELSDNEFIELVITESYIGLEYIPKRYIHLRKYYTRQHWRLYLILNTYLQQCVERLNDLNCYNIFLKNTPSS
jgi:hypothetical protein